MVELDDFIEATIKNIIDGVDAVRVEHKDRVASPNAATVKIEGQPSVASHDGTFWTVVSFDVALTVSEERQKKIGGNVKAGFKVLIWGSGSADVGGSAGKTTTSEGVHRVTFAVPLRLSDKQST